MYSIYVSVGYSKPRLCWKNLEKCSAENIKNVRWLQNPLWSKLVTFKSSASPSEPFCPLAVCPSES